jgi:hypothetical protein
MLWKIGYSLPNGKSFCFTSRSCTSSIGLMALKQFHPDRVPDHPLIDGQAHRLNDYVLGTSLPEGCAVMVRDPVERFRSNLGKMGVTADNAFAWLWWHYGLGTPPQATDRMVLEYTAGTTWHHFTPVSMFAQADSKLFRFPDVAGMAAYLGLTGDVENINVCADKPTLTADDEAKVRSIYAADIALWESLPHTEG